MMRRCDWALGPIDSIIAARWRDRRWGSAALGDCRGTAGEAAGVAVREDVQQATRDRNGTLREMVCWHNRAPRHFRRAVGKQCRL
jgi:hypothetical protein